ncbi:MAG: glutathione S- transferase, nitrogen catabolite repression regulator [Alectoria sarmentosa]|nr:MAG: glutathione S- transferase, nitrogen catabolite repression regulator [Alectoria sarmentosa]CAD6566720.1 MAG: glutathione S- transferase, nitrogen catabolite repression regulator [Alectoria sarmentosa]
MASLQSITLHGHPGPNPWKVSLLLDELNVPYTTKIYTTPELKQPAFLALNRNGMAPVIEDPNEGLLLAESGAIMDYIIDRYDTEKRITFTTLPEQYHMKQWLQFQTTTQGPVLQGVFHWSFVESNPEAHASYVKHLRRVLQVLNDELAGKDWLVGGKCSAADLSYVPFHSKLEFIMRDAAPDVEKDFPNVDAWYKRMLERDTVQKMLTDRDEATKKLSFPGKK